MKLAETITKLNRLTKARAMAIKEHDRIIFEMDQIITSLNDRLNLSGQGFLTETVDLAKSVIDVQGQFSEAGQDRKTVMQDALTQLASGNYYGTNGLQNCYLGTKNFDRWHGQRVSPPYYASPTHGHVIFKIGLTNEVRNREPFRLTPEEIEAAIYYLNALEMIQDAEGKARAS